MSKTRLAPELYLNRELGQLAFNRRVLAQAENRIHPLLERLKFLCIVSSNLDEFFEIRVAGLKAEIEAGAPPVGPDHMRADQVFLRVAREAHELVAAQYRLLNEEILPGLEKEGIRFLRRSGFHGGPGRMDQGLFFPRSDAGADADRARSGAPVSARAQQEPEFRRRTGRQGRLRAQFGHRHRAGAARAAARDPPAARDCGRRS